MVKFFSIRKREPVLLTVEFLHEHGLYMVIPCEGRKECQIEYLFSNYLDAKEFIDAFLQNPCGAHFAYAYREMHAL